MSHTDVRYSFEEIAPPRGDNMLPSRKKFHDGTVPSRNKYRDGTVSVPIQYHEDTA